MSKVQVSVEALKGRRENGREFLRLGNRWGKLPFPYPCWNPPYLDLLWGEVGILHMVRSPSGPTLSPALGAVYQLLQPAIQSDLLSAVSSFYLCQSQVLCGRKGRQACARPALQIYHLGSNVHLWHPAALSSLPGFPLQSPRHEAVCAVLGARGQPVRSRRGSGKWHWASPAGTQGKTESLPAGGGVLFEPKSLALSQQELLAAFSWAKLHIFKLFWKLWLIFNLMTAVT